MAAVVRDLSIYTSGMQPPGLGSAQGVRTVEAQYGLSPQHFLALSGHGLPYAAIENVLVDHQIVVMGYITMRARRGFEGKAVTSLPRYDLADAPVMIGAATFFSSAVGTCWSAISQASTPSPVMILAVASGLLVGKYVATKARKAG